MVLPSYNVDLSISIDPIRKSLTDMPIGQSRQPLVDSPFQLILDGIKLTAKANCYMFAHPVFS